MPIESLKRIIVSEDEDGTQTSRLPNNQEMMDKINEVIKYVNMIDMKVTGMAHTMHKQEVKNMFKPRK
ncbi:hypothetical protein ABWK22_02365 [Gottfriedia acidiceleris]|uniref:hypothetical protein n=1 Tax=Gottfriedia acidiceleris TaxID=371036 RepID=UPI00339A0AB8